MKSKNILSQYLFRISRLFFALLFLLPSYRAWSVSYPPNRLKTIDSVVNDTWKSREQNAEKICTQALTIPFPSKDKPLASEIQELKGCDSYNLYYGFDKPSEPIKARKCAYLEKEHPNAMWGGAPVLMMVYANGKGIERNLGLALRLACERKEDSTPAEYLGRIEHLDQMRKEKIIGEPFDFCDDITSGFSQGECTLKQSLFDNVIRTKRLEELIAKWTDSDRQAYKILLTDWRNYLKYRECEIDQSGTARTAMLVENHDAMESDFLESLLKFEQGVFPRFTESEFAKADQELNQVYKKIQGNDSPDDMGTVTKADVKKAQRAWLKFRDAWVIFTKQKYPPIDAVDWKTWLTKSRTKLLQDGFAF